MEHSGPLRSHISGLPASVSLPSCPSRPHSSSPPPSRLRRHGLVGPSTLGALAAH